MKIPVVKSHIDHQFRQFNSAYGVLCLEENRQPENIQICKEKLHGLKTLIDTLDNKLEDELKESIK